MHFGETLSETISYTQKSQEQEGATTHSTCHLNHQLVHGPLGQLLEAARAPPRPQHTPTPGGRAWQAGARRILLQRGKQSSEDDSAAAARGHGQDDKGAESARRVSRDPRTEGPRVARATWHTTQRFIKLLEALRDIKLQTNLTKYKKN